MTLYDYRRQFRDNLMIMSRTANGMLDLSRPLVDDASGYKATGWNNAYQQLVDVDPSWAKPFKAHNTTVGRDARFYSCFVPNGFWWP